MPRQIIDRLPDEIPEDEWIKLRPHPFSFMHLYILSLFLMGWGIFLYLLFNDSSQWSDFESRLNDYVGEDSLGGIAGNAGGATLLWFAGLIIAGFLASHFWIEKGGFRILFIFVLIGIVGIGIISYIAKTDKDALVDFYKWFLPLLTIGFGAIGTFGIDWYRRGFHYLLTNLRVVIAKKFITLDERIVRYNHLEDVQVNQGIVGRIFSFGHVIPLTGSGIATGTEESIAMGGVGKDVKGVDVGVAGGSKKSIRKAKPSPGDVLFGVKNPLKLREIISKYIQENTGVSVMKRQEETMGKIEQLLSQQQQSKGTIPNQPDQGQK